jgi:hypothetical protein
VTTVDSCAEVLAGFHRYEAALVAGDIDVMGELFADSPELVRFGITDLQVGSAELEKWRHREPPLPPGRRLFDTRVMAVGPDAAVITTLFDYPGRTWVGRQSQTWHRTEAGWKIVHAHVSVVTQHVP